MGYIDRGVDFLGYRHTPAGCYPAQETIKRFKTRLSRLYEQGADDFHICMFQTRWWRWVCDGFPKGWVLVKQTADSARPNKFDPPPAG